MATRISNTARNEAVDAVTALLDSGGYVEVRTGTQPASVGTAASGTLLATLELSSTAFGAGSSGTATANAVDQATAVASGTAGWFRAYDSSDAGVIDGNTTGTGGGGDMELDDPDIVQGGTVNVTSWTITMPGG